MAARAGRAAVFGYLCLRRNEFQLEYQSQRAHPHPHPHPHTHAQSLTDSLGLIWVYLFLKKANSAAMCPVLQRNRLHFEHTVFLSQLREDVSSPRRRRSSLRRVFAFQSLSFPFSETETIHHCRVLAPDCVAQFLKCFSGLCKAKSGDWRF